MTTSTTNTLVQVQVYNSSALGCLENECPILDVANKEFEKFENEAANLGSSTNFDKPPRFTYSAGLVAQFQPANQIVSTLTCDQAINVAYEFTVQDQIFNVDKDVDSYMFKYGNQAVFTMGTAIESNLAQNLHSQVSVNTVVGAQTVPTGLLHYDSGPYRFYGDGFTPINSVQQLSQMKALFQRYGAATTKYVCILPNTAVPAIIGTSLNQFVPRRNEEMANSWDLGEWNGIRFLESNLLPEHTSGNVGNASGSGNVLTVISTNDPTGANITQITCSGATASDPMALLSGDTAQFVSGVSGYNNVNFLTYIGNIPTSLPTQFRVTTGTNLSTPNVVAATSGGHVTFNIYPPLQATAGATQNISTNIVAGMKIQFSPTHQTGVLMSGDAFFVAMPRLKDQKPFDTASERSKNGVAIRMTTGSLLGQNFTGTIHDCTWGSIMVPEYAMRMQFPAGT